MKDTELEIFLDSAYYDMYCLRWIGDKQFESTIHFKTKEEAEHARFLILEWYNQWNLSRK
jgi:hypothetical protein